MLKAAHAALVEFGALAPSDRLPPFWARMSGNLVLMVYPKDSPFYLVKIGIRTSLDREFRGLATAHAAMPRNVPRPLGLTTQGSFQVLVTLGLHHQQLALRHRRDGMRMLEDGIDALLAAGLSHFQASPADCGVNVQDALKEASEALDWAGWRAYWDHVRALIAPLPRILQHGDLAMTNIAIADGELVFFDWEDFGLVDVIGFDLAVVLLSLNDFDTVRLRARLAAPTAEAALARRGCARLNLSTNLFLELFPLYLSLFVKVKRSWGYDQAVSARAIAALRDWLSAGPAHVAAG